jgi:hypothetical protein
VRAKSSRSFWLWSAALIVLGVILLLNNYLLITGFNVASLWPLLLVLAGALILLRGDLFPADSGRNFGITRGSVESATLEINAGAVDVSARPLHREGRLIAGQFAADTRPALDVQHNHAHLKMDRSATPLLSLANWDMALAHDLPWAIYVSTNLGQIQLDLKGLIVAKAVIASGIGDIRLECPAEAFEPLEVRSAVGSIQILTPPGTRARVTVHGSRVFRVIADAERYVESEPGIYTARDADERDPWIELHVRGTFGSAYLA